VATIGPIPLDEVEKLGWSRTFIGWFFRLLAVVENLAENAGASGVFPSGNRVMISDVTGKLSESSITTTELNYLDGATSNLQTQLTTLDNTTEELKRRLFMQG